MTQTRRELRCSHCGEMFKRNWNTNGKQNRNPKAFCSRSCSGAHHRKSKPVVVRLKYCKTCSKPIAPRNTYCSDDCRPPVYIKPAHEERNCKECSKRFVPQHGASLFCSTRCSRKASKRNEPHYNHRKRAKRAGVLYDNSVKRIDVFERDHWMCQACYVATPRSLVGTLLDNAPELDHLLPISLGGSHTWDNVRCTCRDCNHRKGAMHPDLFIHPFIIMQP